MLFGCYLHRIGCFTPSCVVYLLGRVVEESGLRRDGRMSPKDALVELMRLPLEASHPPDGKPTSISILH